MSDLNANVLTKDQFDSRRKEDRTLLWVVAGVVVAALALFIAAYQTWGPKENSAESAQRAIPQPIIIQLPTPAPAAPRSG
jgi:hypothetical protein